MKKQGFTLIELMIVIAIIGIIAAIAVPNMLTAIQKGRQKATMADMRTVGMAIEAYSTDIPMVPGGGTFTLLSETAPYLVPFHIRYLPEKDAWGEPFRYQSGAMGVSQWDYSIISYGKDRLSTTMDTANTSYIVNTMKAFSNDICFCNGSFSYAPKVK